VLPLGSIELLVIVGTYPR